MTPNERLLPDYSEVEDKFRIPRTGRRPGPWPMALDAGAPSYSTSHAADSRRTSVSNGYQPCWPNV